MIGKTKIGKSFKGCLQYVMTKPEAEVLDYQFCRASHFLKTTDDFNSIRLLRPELTNAVWHTSISFAYTDTVDNQLMKTVAKEYLKLMGMEESQHIIVRHHDTKHKHIHLVVNRIKTNGQVITDQFSKNRTAKACDQLEEKYGLTIARHINRSSEKDKIPQKEKAKNEIRQALQHYFTGKDKEKSRDLESYLKDKGIAIQIARQSTGRINGIIFHYEGQSYKGSAIGKEYKFSKMEPYLSKKLMENPSFQDIPEPHTDRPTIPKQSENKLTNKEESKSANPSIINEISKEKNRKNQLKR